MIEPSREIEALKDSADPCGIDELIGVTLEDLTIARLHGARDERRDLADLSAAEGEHTERERTVARIVVIPGI